MFMRPVLILALLLTLNDLCAAPRSGDYVLVVSRQTLNDPAWESVVSALLVKNHGLPVINEKELADIRDELGKSNARYACFVAKPEECNRDFVATVHRLTRQLDADPYTDVIWGIVTGHSASDALRIAKCSKPLVVRKGAGGTGIPLNIFEEGIWYDEGRKNHAIEKVKGGKPADKVVPDDTTKLLVDTFNVFQTDLFMTSGHATERDWQIGYSFKNGQFRCKDGVLMGVDTRAPPTKSIHPIPRCTCPWATASWGMSTVRKRWRSVSWVPAVSIRW